VLASIAIFGLALSHAQAWDNEEETDSRQTARRAGTEEMDLPLRRTYRYETNFRARYLSVPNSILDIWFFNNDADGANPYPRPKVRAYTAGAEFVLKKDPANWTIYFEYMGNLMAEGYWDDVDKPVDPTDGDWVRPDGLGMLVLGSNYGHEIHATPWWSFVFGGGLGLGVLLGDLTTWGPGASVNNQNDGCFTTSPAYIRKDNCAEDGTKRIPKVLPVVDMTVSSRFHFGDQANLRVDLGLHNMLYIGTAFGAVY
jgi:hypothetical protein